MSRHSHIAPSPQRGEGRGEGVRRPKLIPNTRHPHPTLSLKGEGLKVRKLLEISVEGS
jgi:hypothetical protein